MVEACARRRKGIVFVALAPSLSRAMLHYWLRPLLYAISSLVLVVTFFLLRTLLVIRQTHSSSRPRQHRSKDAEASLAIFLGSGASSAPPKSVSTHKYGPQEGTRQR